jgi:hypothetical protein
VVTFTATVRLKRLTPALKTILDVLYALDGSAAWFPPDLVVTSVNDSKHRSGSRHYVDEAVDVRSHNFASQGDRISFRELLANRLGPRFTVLLEDEGLPNEHFHIQPKKGTTFP